jgi:alpha-mannosidase
MRLIACLPLLCALTSTAQVDLPVFGKQDVINGYAKDIEGEVLSYFSVYPEHATTALLTRCTDGAKAIAWETAAVPFLGTRESTQYFYFSWIAAHNSTTSGGDRSFDLFINDQLALTFTTHHSTKPGLMERGRSGQHQARLRVQQDADRHGDAHGFAHLRVPRKYITPGQPVKLESGGPRAGQPGLVHDLPVHFRGEGGSGQFLPFLYNHSHSELQPCNSLCMHFWPLHND